MVCLDFSILYAFSKVHKPLNSATMKKLYVLLFTAIFMVTSLSAQLHLFLEEQEIELEDSRSSAWVFPVAHDLDEALDDLKNYCKDRSGVKLKKDGENMMIAEKVSIPTIVTKRGDLIGYGFITEKYYGIAMIFQMGYDISINSKEWEAEMKNFRNYSKSFMSYHYEQSYKRLVVELQKEIDTLEKQKGQAEKNINGLNNKVANLNKKIAKETDEAKIEGYKAEIATLESDISAQSDPLPDIQSQIDKIRETVDNYNTELHTFQGAIGSF